MGGTMTAHELLTDLDRLGIPIEAHGDRLRYSPRSAVTPDLAQRMKAHKPALLAILAGETWDTDVLPEANEANWAAISDADREYLLGPREQPTPCPWCSGRLVHSETCRELRRQWSPVIPFGKHRGRHADEVPADYIDWILAKGTGDKEFRDELRRWRESSADLILDKAPINR